MKSLKLFATIFLTILVGVAGYLTGTTLHNRIRPIQVAVSTPSPAPKGFPADYLAALDVARVFGRSPACAEATPDLIHDIAVQSLKAGIDSRIMAATIAVESGCDQFATSNRGAIGLTQVMPKIWKGSYNFEKDYNLLNPQDNIHVGASILAGLIKQYGTTNGIHRYNGLGTGCDTCDTGYADRINALAARR